MKAFHRAVFFDVPETVAAGEAVPLTVDSPVSVDDPEITVDDTTYTP